MKRTLCLAWVSPLANRYQVATLGRLAKLGHCTQHTLGHLFAKNLVDQSVSLDKVATLMGQSDDDCAVHSAVTTGFGESGKKIDGLKPV